MIGSLGSRLPGRASWFRAAAAVALLLFAPACKKSAPADVAATVNNQVIKYTELEDAYRQSQLATSGKGSNEEQVMAQKLQVLQTLIDSEVMRQRAEKAGLLAGDADVETNLSQLKAPYTKEQFEEQLRRNNMTLNVLKGQIRTRLSIERLINKEITSHITITDADIAAFYNANKGSFNVVEPRVHLAQILVTPTPDPNVRNLSNTKAQNDADARRKIAAVLNAVKEHPDDFAKIAQGYSEDSGSVPNGGDLGFLPESALDKASPEIRKAVSSLLPGGISGVIRTDEGYRIIKVISRDTPGQRKLDDPSVQQDIRDTLRTRKLQLLQAAYYEVARDDAKIVNYLARKVLESASRAGK
jgi:peptidyl-prolyl cis-trans isomerase SurA